MAPQPDTFETSIMITARAESALSPGSRKYGALSAILAAWPTKGQIYFARLDRNGAVLPPGEIKTPGTNGMRTGVLALSGTSGAALIAWKNNDTLGWQCYHANGLPQGSPGRAPSAGSGAAGVVLPDGKSVLFP